MKRKSLQQHDFLNKDSVLLTSGHLPMGLPPSSHEQMLLFLYGQFIQNFLRSKFQQNKKFTSIQGTYNRTQQEKNKMKQSFCLATSLEKVTFQLLW